MSLSNNLSTNNSTISRSITSPGAGQTDELDATSTTSPNSGQIHGFSPPSGGSRTPGTFGYAPDSAAARPPTAVVSMALLAAHHPGAIEEYFRQLHAWRSEGNATQTDARQEAVDRVRANVLAREPQLSLSNLQLAELPPGVLDLPWITDLNLALNHLTALPDSAGNRSLQDLNLFANQISRFPEWVGDMPALRRLNASFNFLQSLPDVIGLPALEQLDLSHNRLDALPEGWARAPALRRLDIDSNPMLPPHDTSRNPLQSAVGLPRHPAPADALRPPSFDALWPDGAPPIAWDSLLDEPGGVEFSDVIGRLLLLPEFRSPLTGPALLRDLQDLIAQMVTFPELRARVFARAEEAVGHCSDQARVGLGDLNATALAFFAERGHFNTDEVLELGRRFFHDEQARLFMNRHLDARRAASAAGGDNSQDFYDETVETLLAIRMDLDREGIALPTRPPTDMDHRMLSRISRDETAELAQMLRAMDGGPQMRAFLADFEPWQACLRTQHAATFDQALEPARQELGQVMERLAELAYEQEAMAYADEERRQTLSASIAATEKQLFRELTQRHFARP